MFILFYRLVTSTYISLWENQVSSKCRYWHLEYLITCVAAAVVNKSSWQCFHAGWIQFQVLTTHQCLCAVCSGSPCSPQTCSQQSQESVQINKQEMSRGSWVRAEWEFTQCGVQTCKTVFRLLNLGFSVSKVNHSQDCCWEEIQFPRHTHTQRTCWHSAVVPGVG